VATRVLGNPTAGGGVASCDEISPVLSAEQFHTEMTRAVRVKHRTVHHCQLHAEFADAATRPARAVTLPRSSSNSARKKSAIAVELGSATEAVALAFANRTLYKIRLWNADETSFSRERFFIIYSFTPFTLDNTREKTFVAHKYAGDTKQGRQHAEQSLAVVGGGHIRLNHAVYQIANGHFPRSAS
jgi:hypothetical protein